jgi:hypothetical protein
MFQLDERSIRVVQIPIAFRRSSNGLEEDVAAGKVVTGVTMLLCRTVLQRNQRSRPKTEKPADASSHRRAHSYRVGIAPTATNVPQDMCRRQVRKEVKHRAAPRKGPPRKEKQRPPLARRLLCVTCSGRDLVARFLLPSKRRPRKKRAPTGRTKNPAGACTSHYRPLKCLRLPQAQALNGHPFGGALKKNQVAVDL